MPARKCFHTDEPCGAVTGSVSRTLVVESAPLASYKTLKKPANPFFRLFYYAGNALLLVPAVVLIFMGARTGIRFGRRFVGAMFVAPPAESTSTFDLLPYVELSTVEVIIAFVLTWVGAIVCWAGISLGLRALSNLEVTKRS